MLVKYHKLSIPHETLRLWLRANAITTSIRKKRPHQDVFDLRLHPLCPQPSLFSARSSGTPRHPCSCRFRRCPPLAPTPNPNYPPERAIGLCGPADSCGSDCPGPSLRFHIPDSGRRCLLLGPRSAFRPGTGQAVAAGRGNLVRMALRNAARNPGRSTLTIGLVAAASFVIVSMDAFRLDPTQQTPTLHSGNGGFALVAESDQPILQDLNSPDARTTLGFSERDQKLLAGSTIVSLRVHGGEDASCLNLYRSRQPRVLGVPRQFIEHDGFAWADKPRDCANPWQLLEVVEQPSRLQEAAGGCRTTIGRAGHPGKEHGQLRAELVGRARRDVRDQRRPRQSRSTPRGRPAGRQHLPGRSIDGRVGLLAALPRHERLPFLSRRDSARANRGGEKDVGAETSASTAFRPKRPAGAWPSFSPCRTRISRRSRVSADWGSCWEPSGWRPCSCETCSSGAANWRCSARRAFAAPRSVGWFCLEHAVLLTAGLGVGTLAASLAVLPHLLHRGAAVPWASLAGTLIAVLIVGLAAGALAVRAVVRAPLLAALREERG